MILDSCRIHWQQNHNSVPWRHHLIYLCWVTFLTTEDMHKMKLGKIQKFLVALKIWHKIWEFWTQGTCKGENLAKSRNFQSLWNFGSKMRVLSTPKQQRMKFDMIQKNFDLSWKYGSKMRFLITPDLPMIKFGKILTFLVPVKIWIKIDILNHSGPGKAESWQNADILSQVENLAQNWHFWPLWTHERWNLAKSNNFEWRWKFWLKIENFDHSGPEKDKIWWNKEILIFFRYFQSSCKFNLKSRVWPPLTCQWWNFDSRQKFSSKLTFFTIQDVWKMKVGKIQKFQSQ